MEELEYIKHAETIKVAVVKGWHPLYCAPEVREHHNADHRQSESKERPDGDRT